MYTFLLVALWWSRNGEISLLILIISSFGFFSDIMSRGYVKHNSKASGRGEPVFMTELQGFSPVDCKMFDIRTLCVWKACMYECVTRQTYPWHQICFRALPSNRNFLGEFWCNSWVMGNCVEILQVAEAYRALIRVWPAVDFGSEKWVF